MLKPDSWKIFPKPHESKQLPRREYAAKQKISRLLVLGAGYQLFCIACSFYLIASPVWTPLPHLGMALMYLFLALAALSAGFQLIWVSRMVGWVLIVEYFAVLVLG